MSDDVLEHAKHVIKTYELAYEYPNSLIFSNNYMGALVHAPAIARALIDTQKRLDEAVYVIRAYESECLCHIRADLSGKFGCERCQRARAFLASIETKGDDE